MDPEDEEVMSSAPAPSASSGARDAAWVEAEVARRQRQAQLDYAKAQGFVVIDGRVYITLGEPGDIGSSGRVVKGI